MHKPSLMTTISWMAKLSKKLDNINSSSIEVNGPRRIAQGVGNAMHIGKKPQAKNEWKRILPIVANLAKPHQTYLSKLLPRMLISCLVLIHHHQHQIHCGILYEMDTVTSRVDTCLSYIFKTSSNNVARHTSWSISPGCTPIVWRCNYNSFVVSFYTRVTI